MTTTTKTGPIITIDPHIMAGAPCIRGMRITATVVAMLRAGGASVESICSDYPDLTPSDVAAAIAYATRWTRLSSEDGQSVRDPDGGVWWPDDETAEEIAASGDPADLAVAIAELHPSRGTWVA